MQAHLHLLLRAWGPGPRGPSAAFPRTLGAALARRGPRPRGGASRAAAAPSPAGEAAAAAAAPEAPEAASRTRRRSAIVCTIGPASEDPATLGALARAGMNVMRMNFSHGQYDEQGARVERLRAYEAERWAAVARQAGNAGLPAVVQKDVHCYAVDLKGPEIRTGYFREGQPRKLALRAGQAFRLHADAARQRDGTPDGIWVDYPLHAHLEVGQRVYIDDGQIQLDVVEKGADHLVCEVGDDALLGERKGLNAPGVELPGLPVLTEYDRRVLEWAVAQDVHAVFASFVRRGEDVAELKAFLAGLGGAELHVMSKIENVQGLANFDDILAASDGIMVARGDLGIEVPMEEVPVAQKAMIRKSNAAGKPVVCATQMMETMEANPRPTRAEVNDVANAVFDGADGVMLSGETGNGAFPARCVATMARIARRAERALAAGEVAPPAAGAGGAGGGLAAAVAALGADGAAVVVPAVASTDLARAVVARAAPGGRPVLVPTFCRRAAAQLMLSGGVQPLLVTDRSGRPFEPQAVAAAVAAAGAGAAEEMVGRLAARQAVEMGWVEDGVEVYRAGGREGVVLVAEGASAGEAEPARRNLALERGFWARVAGA